jgi:hypothetical protein
MDSFLFTFGGDAVSNFQLMFGGDPARCGDLHKGGVIMAARGPKGQQKYNRNRIFTAVAPNLAPLDFFPDP